jgi:AcrR family transcriptional regulator
VSPRPRKVSDQDVFAAAYRAMLRLGPRELTLADIAGEAGVTAGALAQRFGSKRALLLRLAESAASTAGETVHAMRAASRSPLGALRAYAECLAEMASSPDALARNLAYLQVDLTDPDFRAALVAQSTATATALRGLLDEAVEARELARGTDTKRLVRMVEVAMSGALLTWAIYQEGSARRFLRHAVDSVLTPHVARRAPRRARASSARQT